MKKELSKSVRDKVLYAKEVKGATPRAYETHPSTKSKPDGRGTEKQCSVKLGKIPKAKSFK